MNAHQRRTVVRQLKKAMPIGSAVKYGDNSAMFSVVGHISPTEIKIVSPQFNRGRALVRKPRQLSLA